MATSRIPPDSTGFSDSDQQWFDRLSGKLGAVTDAQAVQQADALKRALQLDLDDAAADPELNASLSDAEEQRRWEQLQFRLKREGLLQTQARPLWRQWPAAAGLAAALVLGTVLVLQRPDQPDYPSPAVMYGETDTQTTQADTPRQAADALAAALRQAGLKAAQYQSGTTYLVDINLQPDELPLAEPGLKALGLVPRPGQTRIAIRPR